MDGIQIKNLHKTYEDGTIAIKNLNVNFKKNKISGFIGFNGSGKTTTFNIMVNFIERYKGKIFFDGKTINEINTREISYLASGNDRNVSKAKNHLLSIANIYEMDKKEALKKIDVLSTFLDFKKYENKLITFLSKGNQQKLKVISCFLNPHLKYLLLDEPFDGLDPIIVKKIIKLLKQLKDVTIIITSHRMEIVDKVCDEYFVLKSGQLVDSKVMDKQNLVIEVNKEVKIEDLKNQKGVLDILYLKEHNLVLIENINYFKDINAILAKKTNYIYSSIKEKDLTSSIFEAYK